MNISDASSSRPRGEFNPWPEAQVHVEWGPLGAELAAARGDGVVIVDVLSFSTTLTMAAERGLTSYVFAKHELVGNGGPAAVAEQLGAVCAVGKRQAEPGMVSLSPASVQCAQLDVTKVLFSSLNGAAAVSAANSAPALAVACLRNRTAAARTVMGWLHGRGVTRVTIVACGEQWSSVAQMEGLRPCLEDYLGAGAVVDAITDNNVVSSIEARTAAAAYRSLATTDLSALVGARELATAGFAEDVSLAAEIDVSDVVPQRTPDPTGRYFVAVPTNEHSNLL